MLGVFADAESGHRIFDVSEEEMANNPEADKQLDPGQKGQSSGQLASSGTESTRIAMNSDERNKLESSLPDHKAEEEPVQAAIALIQGKWKIGILSRLQHGPLRLSQLRRLFPGASKKMLTQQLREMEKDGLVVRSDQSAKVRHVEYSLSASLGSDVLRLIGTLAQWGKQHKPDHSQRSAQRDPTNNDE
jgi:DNA-binding HxlR family transcriptional regulator